MDGKKVLIAGSTGMLGHVLFRLLSRHAGLEVHGTARSGNGLSRWFTPALLERVHTGIDACNFDAVRSVLAKIKPDVVINCVGIIKQSPEAKDPVASISVNALFPHKLAALCKDAGARMIHISTDCVFSGDKGGYTEDDRPDADDLYGRTKLLGEVVYPHCVTLRTSIIGHELKGKHSLLEWFLSQEGKVRGFTRAVFSGFPTVEMARIIADRVIPDEKLTGLYHVSSEPVTKYDLLKLVAGRYGKTIDIERDDNFHCDRSLKSERFKSATGYSPPQWPKLVEAMHKDAIENEMTGADKGRGL
ncbi:MAG: SDR family oxidoreductase [Thermodesulfobacteriota bacterium]